MRRHQPTMFKFYWFELKIKFNNLFCFVFYLDYVFLSSEIMVYFWIYWFIIKSVCKKIVSESLNFKVTLYWVMNLIICSIISVLLHIQKKFTLWIIINGQNKSSDNLKYLCEYSIYRQLLIISSTTLLSKKNHQ